MLLFDISVLSVSSPAWDLWRIATEVSLFWPRHPPLSVPPILASGLGRVSFEEHLWPEKFCLSFSNLLLTLESRLSCRSFAASGFFELFPLRDFNKCVRKRLTSIQSRCEGARGVSGVWLSSQPLPKCLYWPQPRIVHSLLFFVQVPLQRLFKINLERQTGEKVKIEKRWPFSAPQVVAL